VNDNRIICITSDSQVEAVQQALASASASADVVPVSRVTTRLQHSLNNPLTALLAEAQLLEMEPLEAEQLEAVKRVVELCRRTVDLVRRLDLVRAASD
jgi:nitrogen-specific signal transduction histidine kinase